jgi:predicted ArsR family transcriptional regulator
VSLPERHYDLAGELMARAIEDAAQRGVDVLDALRRAAADTGAAIGEQTRARVGADASAEAVVAACCDTLAEHGYEPRRHDDQVTLANCPFHTLAREHTELVCGMNLSLIEAAVHELGPGRLTARLSPTTDGCCVAITSQS